MPASSKTDWDRIKREAAADAPVVHEADSPYDPNVPEAVDAFWEQATVRRKASATSEGPGQQARDVTTVG